MSEGFGEIFERARQKIMGSREIPVGNGVKLAAKIHQENPSLSLRKGNELLVDLRTFAPEDTRIVFNPKQEWQALPGNTIEKPILKIGSFNGVEDILNFLHECGHLQEFGSINADIALSASQQYDEKYFDKETQTSERIQDLYEKHKAVLTSERSAWAYSLRTVRNLERQYGINIIQRMGSTSGVINYINECLSEYEGDTQNELKSMGFEVFDKKDVEKILQTMAA